MPRFTRWPLSVRLPDKNFVRICHLRMSVMCSSVLILLGFNTVKNNGINLSEQNSERINNFKLLGNTAIGGASLLPSVVSVVLIIHQSGQV
jgi:hypothetical protein